MEFIGFAGAIIVGIILSILGAGGSIITIPILIYLFHLDALDATTYAFFIVGFTAFIGSLEHLRNKTVQLWPALYFALPGIISIYLIRQFVLEEIPINLFSIQQFVVTKDIFILLFFACIMLVAGISMLVTSSKKEPAKRNVTQTNLYTLAVLGFLVGIMIAFAGVGGGFLITPSLLLFAKLPIKKAIGTSLCIISLNSFVGFFSSLQMHAEMDWRFLFSFVFFTTVGLLGGKYFFKRISSESLKKIFGTFVILIAIFIVVNELFLNL